MSDSEDNRVTLNTLHFTRRHLCAQLQHNYGRDDRRDKADLRRERIPMSNPSWQKKVYVEDAHLTLEDNYTYYPDLSRVCLRKKGK